MEDELPSPPNTETKPFAARIENWADSFSRTLHVITKVIAFAFVSVAWLIFGFVAWLGMLVTGIPILFVVILIALLAGFSIQRVTRRFVELMIFFPEGFKALARAFWSEDTISESEPSVIGERSYSFAAAKVLYGIFVVYVFFFAIYLIFNPTYGSVVIFLIPLILLLSGTFVFMRYWEARKTQTLQSEDPPS